MAQRIYLNNDQVFQIVYNLRLTAQQLFDRADRLYARAAHAEWEGAAKDEFCYQIYTCTAKLKDLSDLLDELGFQLTQELEQWQHVSSRFHH